MTFSLVGRCERTGMVGTAVSSSSPAVAARCAHARAGAGAAASQNVTDPRLGPAVLELMGGGRTAQQAVDAALAKAPGAAYRQVTAVDGSGSTGAFSGAYTLGTHAAAHGPGAVAAGNLLASPDVPAAMVEAFAADPGAHLGARLIAALRAGLEAGGEEGPVRSAGVVVCDRVEWPVVDLRVDWDGDPIARLTDLWAIWEPQIGDYVTRALDPASAPGYGVPGDEGS
jgi:uncharacterized Ntn-hydrolase superfamily protein